MTSTHTLARRDDRATSFEAAARQTTGVRAVLYAVIIGKLNAYGPMTDEELLHRLEQGHVPCTPSGVRSRRNELVLNGWVTEFRDDNQKVVKRRGTSGSPCTVWRAVQPGEDHTAPAPMRRSKGAILGDESTPEHTAGLAAARRAATWHLGDPYWGNLIVEAYLSPEAAHANLDREESE